MAQVYIRARGVKTELYPQLLARLGCLSEPVRKFFGGVHLNRPTRQQLDLLANLFGHLAVIPCHKR
jgi:hypothetical protein